FTSARARIAAVDDAGCAGTHIRAVAEQAVVAGRAVRQRRARGRLPGAGIAGLDLAAGAATVAVEQVAVVALLARVEHAVAAVIVGRAQRELIGEVVGRVRTESAAERGLSHAEGTWGVAMGHHAPVLEGIGVVDAAVARDLMPVGLPREE